MADFLVGLRRPAAPAAAPAAPARRPASSLSDAWAAARLVLEQQAKVVLDAAEASLEHGAQEGQLHEALQTADDAIQLLAPIESAGASSTLSCKARAFKIRAAAQRRLGLIDDATESWKEGTAAIMSAVAAGADKTDESRYLKEISVEALHAGVSGLVVHIVEQLARTCAESGEKAEEAAAWRLLAQARLLESEESEETETRRAAPAEALRAAERAVALARELGQPFDEALALHSEAQAHLVLSDSVPEHQAKALAAATDALARLSALETEAQAGAAADPASEGAAAGVQLGAIRREQARTLLTLVGAHANADGNAEALKAAGQALGRYRELGDRLGEAAVWRFVSMACHMTSGKEMPEASARQVQDLVRDFGRLPLPLDQPAGEDKSDALVPAGESAAEGASGALVPAGEQRPLPSKEPDGGWAIWAIDRALELYSGGGADNKTMAIAKKTAARARLARGEIEEAIADARQAVELGRSVSCGARLLATSLNILSRALVLLCRWQEARLAAVEALEIAQQYGEPFLTSRVRHSVLDVTFLTEDYDRAMQIAMEEREMMEETRNLEGESVAMRALAKAQWMSISDTDPFPAAEKALALAQQSGSTSAEVDALLALSDFHMDAEDSEKTVERLSQAREVHRKAGDSEKEVAALHALSDVHWSFRNMDKALQAAEEARELSRQAPSKKVEVNALRVLSGVHAAMEERGKALEAAREMRVVCKGAGDPKGEAEALYLAAALNLEAEEVGEAMAAVEDVRTVGQQVGDNALEVEALQTLSNMHLAAGDAEKAQQAIHAVLASCQGAGDAPGEVRTLHMSASWKLHKGEKTEAMEAMAEARQVGQRAGDLELEAKSLQAHAELRLAAGEIHEAIRLRYEAGSLLRKVGDRRGEAHNLQRAATLHLQEHERLQDARLAQAAALAAIAAPAAEDAAAPAAEGAGAGQLAVSADTAAGRSVGGAADGAEDSVAEAAEGKEREEFEAAVAAAEQAFALFQAGNFHRDAVDAAVTIAKSHFQGRAPDEAVKACERAAPHLQILGDRSYKAALSLWAAEAFMALYEEATDSQAEEDLSARAAELARQSAAEQRAAAEPSPAPLARALSVQAQAEIAPYASAGPLHAAARSDTGRQRLRRALEAATEAVALLDNYEYEVDSGDLGEAFLTAAKCHLLESDSGAALHAAKSAMVAYGDAQDGQGIGNACLWIARAHVLRHQMRDAIEWATRATQNIGRCADDARDLLAAIAKARGASGAAAAG